MIVSPVPQTPSNATVVTAYTPAPTNTAPIDTVLFNDDSMFFL